MATRWALTPSSVVIEKAEPRAPRPPRAGGRNTPRTADKKSSTDKPANTDKPRGRRPERTAERSANNSADKSSGARNQRNTRNSRPAATTAAPELPVNRDPEVFLDDAIDNFGNSVDYVSPLSKQRPRPPS